MISHEHPKRKLQPKLTMQVAETVPVARASSTSLIPKRMNQYTSQEIVQHTNDRSIEKFAFACDKKVFEQEESSNGWGGKESILEEESAKGVQWYGSLSQESIEIEVEDPKQGQKKNFKALKQVLLSQIPYFEKYLRNEPPGYLVRIQVLSDIVVFEWIIQYAEYNFYQNLSIYQKDYYQRPNLNTHKPAISLNKLSSILNSAEYLGMDTLVKQCIKFAAKNIEDLSRLHRSMLGFSKSSVWSIATYFGVHTRTIEMLLSLQDSYFKDSLIRAKVLQQLLCSDVFQCKLCKQLLTDKQYETFDCEKAEQFIEVNGSLRRYHMLYDKVTLYSTLNHTSKANLDWKSIYIWLKALITNFECAQCGMTFNALNIRKCSTGKVSLIDFQKFVGNSNCDLNFLDHVPILKTKELQYIYDLICKYSTKYYD